MGRTTVAVAAVAASMVRGRQMACAAVIAGLAVAGTGVMADTASAHWKRCRQQIAVSYVTLDVRNRVPGVTPSCSDAVGVAFHAIDRGYPRSVRFWWRGRVLSMRRKFFYRGDYVVVDYANRTQWVSFYSDHRYNDPCVVLLVDC